MRKVWIIGGVGTAVVLALGAGVWIGAVYHSTLPAFLSPSSPTAAIAADHHPAATAGDSARPHAKPKPLYRCNMHPWIIQDHPGPCPICKMPLSLVPGSENGLNPATVMIDPAVVQNMGVQTAIATVLPLTKTLRTVGSLEVPETGLYDITLKVNGYIDKLYADKTGMHIHKGDPLFDLYSPDLIADEEELIAARKSADAMKGASDEVRKQSQNLVASARRKLALLDIPDDKIDTIAAQDHAPKEITIHSPAEGHLADKMIVKGSAVQAGMKLMRIEDHSTLWLEAKVYEEQLPLVKIGEDADATLDAIPARTFTGKIIFISPHLDHMNRTVDIRIALDNADFALKPGMYATVQIHAAPVPDALTVPREAVIDTGTRKIAFVEETAGHFTPRDVTTGLSGDDDKLQILSGIAPGEKVVTSGQFLMDVESRSQEAENKLLEPAQPATASTAPESTESAVSTSAPATTTMSTGQTDDLLKAYLAAAAYLQRDDTASKPLDVSALLAAAKAQPAASSLTDAIAAMQTQTLAQQHKSFEAVGAALIPLIDKDPPSSAIGSTLYILHCPMEKADWLQTDPAVHNPFLTDMRTCGSVSRTLPLSPAK